MFDAQFQQRCESIHLAARRRWGRRLLGRPLELRLAGGTEATDQADYSSGDDLQYVDWYRCARHDELLTNRFQGNEDNYVYVLLDCSASMKPGESGKFEFARRLAATLGYLAIANSDRLGVFAFSEGIISQFPTVRGKRHLPKLFGYFDELSIQQEPTDLKKAVESFARLDQPRGTVAVISDFYDAEGFEPAIDTLRRNRYHPFLFQVEDPVDIEPDWSGNVRIGDVESKWSVGTTLEEADLVHYREVYAEFRRDLRRYCARYSIGLVHARCDEAMEHCLQQMMHTATAPMTSG